LCLFCQCLTTTGRLGRMVGTSMLLAVVSLSAWHFARTANLQYTLDWRDDAATKTMMADLEHTIQAERSAATTVLAVEWNYAPVAVYYARRREPADVDVVVTPSTRSGDFVYLAARHARGSA